MLARNVCVLLAFRAHGPSDHRDGSAWDADAGLCKSEAAEGQAAFLVETLVDPYGLPDVQGSLSQGSTEHGILDLFLQPVHRFCGHVSHTAEIRERALRLRLRASLRQYGTYSFAKVLISALRFAARRPSAERNKSLLFGRVAHAPLVQTLVFSIPHE